MKKIGILGGLGPSTTADFYLAINAKLSEIKRPEIVIWNAPLDRHKEEKYIKGLGCREYYNDILSLGVKKLNDARVDFICIPCNTVHEFHKKLQIASHIPIIHIVEEVVKYLNDRNISKALLLGTSQLIQQKLYQQFGEAYSIEFVVPNQNEQKMIDATIVEILKFPDKKKEFEKKIFKIIKNYGEIPIVLGCTDLQGMFTNKICFDSIKILQESVIRKALG